MNSSWWHNTRLWPSEGQAHKVPPIPLDLLHSDVSYQNTVTSKVHAHKKVQKQKHKSKLMQAFVQAQNTNENEPGVE